MTDTLVQAAGWSFSVERGPRWLFVRLQAGDNRARDDHAVDAPPLSSAVWAVMQQHLVDRLVLEMDNVGQLTSVLIGQLVLLHKRIHASGGIMRLSGLADANQQVLRMAQLEDRFPRYVRRDEAVRGLAPNKPR